MQGVNIQGTAAFPAVSIFGRVRHLAGYPLTRRNEPFLDEVMSDPVIRQLMTADNLSETDVRRAIKRAQSNLRLR